MRDHPVMASIPLDDQGRSPFRAAVETKDFGRVVQTLAPAVTFRSPVVFGEYEGRDSVAALLRVVGEVLAPQLAYQWQVHDGDREVLSFTSRVGDREIEGVDLLRYDDQGWVAELVVMMRPLSALLAVRDAVGAGLAALAGGGAAGP
jgi:limonene-1,2-epoxide hydrolase